MISYNRAHLATEIELPVLLGGVAHELVELILPPPEPHNRTNTDNNNNDNISSSSSSSSSSSCSINSNDNNDNENNKSNNNAQLAAAPPARRDRIGAPAENEPLRRGVPLSNVQRGNGIGAKGS